MQSATMKKLSKMTDVVSLDFYRSKFSCSFAIKDFKNKCMKKIAYDLVHCLKMTSPKFTLGPMNHEFRLKIEFYPRGKILKGNEPFVVVKAALADPNSEIRITDLKAAFREAENPFDFLYTNFESPLHLTVNSPTFTTETVCGPKSCEITRMARKNNNEINIIVSGYYWIKYPIKQQKCDQTVVKDLERVLESGLLSDVTVIVDGKKFPAHKSILIARSQIFKTIFEASKNGKSSEILTIPNFSAAVFEAALQYMYTDACPMIKEVSYDLFKFADQYQLPGLKDLCIKALIKQTSALNICLLCNLAREYKCHELYISCVNFLKVITDSEITTTDEWMKFKDDHPDVVSEIYDHLVIN